MRGPAAFAFKEFREAWKAGGARRDEVMGPMLLGTAVQGYIAFMLINDRITGNLPEDQKERALWEAEQRTPYSVRFGNSNEWTRIKDVSLVGDMFALVADAGTALIKHNSDDGMKGKTAQEAWLATSAMLTKACMDRTTLSAVAAAFSAYASGSAADFERLEESYGSLMVPSILGNSAKTLDPHKKEIRGMLDMIKSKIPGLREELPNQYDVFGRAKDVGLYGAAPHSILFNPFPVSPGVPLTSVEQEIVDNKIYLGRMPKEMNYLGVAIDLDAVPGAYSRLAQLAGTIALPAFGNKPLLTTLNDMVEGRNALSRQYAAATPGEDGTKADLIREVIGYYREAAKEQLLRENKDVAALYTANANELRSLQQ
jgi:hypothetical protein